MPAVSVHANAITTDADVLSRRGSEFTLRPDKIKIHHLQGLEGREFISAIREDFTRHVSDRRVFIDSTAAIEDVLSQLVLARKDESPLRVLRDADLIKLHNFKVSNTMRSLERVSTLVDPDEVRKLVRDTVSHIQSALSGNGDWVSTLDVQCRLLSIAASCDAWTEAKPLIRWMDTKWRSIARLRKSGGLLKYRDQEVIRDRSALVSMRNYLHERRVQALTGALRPRSRRRFERTFRAGLAYREGQIRFSDLLKKRDDCRMLTSASAIARTIDVNHVVRPGRNRSGRVPAYSDSNIASGELSSSPNGVGN